MAYVEDRSVTNHPRSEVETGAEQMPDAVRHTKRTWHLLGGATVFDVLVVVTLDGGWCRALSSKHSRPWRNRLLWMNVILLVMYGLAAILVWHQRPRRGGSACRC
jgi:hypothetical protein